MSKGQSPTLEGLEVKCCNHLPDGYGGLKRCHRKGYIEYKGGLYCWFCLPVKTSGFKDELEEVFRNQRKRIVQRLGDVEPRMKRRRDTLTGQYLENQEEEVMTVRGHYSGPKRPNLEWLDNDFHSKGLR